MCKYILIVANKALSGIDVEINKMRIADAWPTQISHLLRESQNDYDAYVHGFSSQIPEWVLDETFFKIYLQLLTAPPNRPTGRDQTKFRFTWNSWPLLENAIHTQHKCNIKSASFTVHWILLRFSTLSRMHPFMHTMTKYEHQPHICNQTQVFIIIFWGGGGGGGGSGGEDGYISCNHFKNH